MYRWSLLAAVCCVLGVGCNSNAELFAPAATAGSGGVGGAGGSSSRATGAGGELVCAPEEQRSCYTGPEGTEGVGVCMAGEQTCSTDGTSWGSCMGEVTPGSDSCATAEDEDCDGTPTPPCSGTYQWSKHLKSTTTDARAVTSDAAGGVIVGGGAWLFVDLGAGPQMTNGDFDAFVAKYDAQGNFVFGNVYPETGYQELNGLGTDAAGNIVLAGDFTSMADFGGMPLVGSSPFYPDVFVAKLNSAGAHMWSAGYGDSGEQEGEDLAVDASGNIVVVGQIKGAIDFGGGALASAGEWDVFVAKLDPNGNHVWSKRFGDAADQRVSEVAVDAAGNVFVTGWFKGTMNFGGANLTSAGSFDIFVVKLAPNGSHLWSKQFGNTYDQVSGGITTDPSGNVVVGGWYEGAMDFGGGALPAAPTSGHDIFLAKLDASAGNHLWSKAFGEGPGYQELMGVSVDATGAVLLTGAFQNSIDFGGGPHYSAGERDSFAAKLDASGAHIWSKRFGSTGNDHGFGVASTISTNVLLAGIFQGTVSFGGPAFNAQTGVDGYLVSLAP